MLSSELANAVRFLSIDAVQKAKSGHPGMPMGMSDIAEVLWRNHLNHNPKNPKWPNRDRFIISNGHGSMLLYSLLHLSGYELSINEIKNFRQLHSKTPGHPEFGYAPGVETTTGPLGQGLSNAVGMAISEKVLANRFNKSSMGIVNHHTYCFVGDGCLMEGISHEVSSLAGTLGLGKLIVFWDDNNISIDGKVDGWFNENVKERYSAYNWQVLSVDGHSSEEIEKAIQDAKMNSTQPTIICCKTKIGYGSPNKVDTASVHGAPLGEDEIKLTRDALNWNYDPFYIPDEIYEKWSAVEQGKISEEQWNECFDQYSQEFPGESNEFKRVIAGLLPENWKETMECVLQRLIDEKPSVASRKASQMSLESICNILPEMFGGSADLTGSNLTNWSKTLYLNHNINGNYLSYGVREFGMSGIMNGISLYGGLKPYGGTFLVFSDYARNAIRMSALMKSPVVYVMTHDSIGLGEDGPTHQPVEHLPSLRLIPNLNVWRPADAFETQVAWMCALESKETPSLLALSRQNLPFITSDISQKDEIEKGGYVVYDCNQPDIVLAATGSEVQLMLQASKDLYNMNINARVVSIPCVDIFKAQSLDYIDSILMKDIPIIFAEASSPELWYSLMPNRKGDVLGISTFGESAPANELFEMFGFTTDNVIEKSLNLLKN